MTETNKRAAVIPAASNGVFCRVPIKDSIKKLVVLEDIYVVSKRDRLIKAVRPMFTEGMDEITFDVIGSVFLHVKLETQMPFGN